MLRQHFRWSHLRRVILTKFKILDFHKWPKQLFGNPIKIFSRWPGFMSQKSKFICLMIIAVCFIVSHHNLLWRLLIWTLPKEQRTRGLSVLTKITSSGHIRSCYTNLDQISSLESRPSINFKISTKHQHLDLT